MQENISLSKSIENYIVCLTRGNKNMNVRSASRPINLNMTCNDTKGNTVHSLSNVITVTTQDPTYC